MATKVSEITNTEVSSYLRLGEASYSELEQLDELIGIAKAFIKGQTGMSDAELDTHPDVVIVVKVLCQDMYDNRTYYVDAQSVNKVVDSILGAYRQNFIPRNLAPAVDNVSTEINTPVRINPLANDFAPYGSIIDKIGAEPIDTANPVTIDHATIETDSNSVLTVIPEAGYLGVLTFIYSATAPDGHQFTSRVVVVVKGVDDATI